MNCPNCRQPLLYCNCLDAAEQIERFLAGAKGKIAKPLYNDLVYRAAAIIEKRIADYGGFPTKGEKKSCMIGGSGTIPRRVTQFLKNFTPPGKLTGFSEPESAASQLPTQVKGRQFPSCWR